MAGSVMTDFEAVRAHRLVQFGFSLLANVSAQLTLVDRVEETSHFFFLTTDLHLHATVGQVPDPSGHIKAFGHVPNRPAETDALDAAFVKNVE
jgi:hypothetical protein